MKEIAPHKWGGLAHRYKVNRLSALRFVDPVTGRNHELPLDHIYESWLVHRFDANVVSLELGDGNVIREANGVLIKATVHLDIRYASGARALEFVGRHRVPDLFKKALVALAEANGARSIVTLRHDLRSESVLVANLRKLRQRMQMNNLAHADAAIRQQLHEVGTSTRGDFADLARSHPIAYIDAFLGFMHCQGVIQLQLDGAPYGRDTQFVYAR